jgi:hypothetical protein
MKSWWEDASSSRLLLFLLIAGGRVFPGLGWVIPNRVFTARPPDPKGQKGRRLKAWHWLRANMTSYASDEGAWEIGESRTKIPGARGYDSCPTAWDALGWAAMGPVLCLVDVLYARRPKGLF